MIDLHSHILPGLDDGARSVEASLEMARIAVADGVTHMACTPHIVQGQYPNASANILAAMDALQMSLKAHAIPLTLISGADVHAAWDVLTRLQAGTIPTLNGTRYFLLEPPHQFLPPRLEDFVRRLRAAGFIPIITHPERLSWVPRHYDIIRRLNAEGCPMQLTADSLLGRFGRDAHALAAQMLDDGLVCLVASDAHGPLHRPPGLSAAMEVVAAGWGDERAEMMFEELPQIVLADGDLPAFQPPPASRQADRRSGDRIRTLFGFLRAEN